MFYSISLFVGGLLAVISLYLLKQSFGFLKNTERAVATVIELERVSGSKGSSTYRPVFKFKTFSNEEITFKSLGSSNPSPWNVGDETPVAYPADNPSKAKTLTYFGIFGWSIILMAIGLPLIVIGGGFYLAQQFLK